MTTITKFVWDWVSDAYLSEFNETNTVTATYTNEPQHYGGALSQRRDGTTSTLHADALGTTRAVTHSTESITDTYVFDAWAQPIANTGSTVLPFKWIGRYGYYADDSTGLVYVSLVTRICG